MRVLSRPDRARDLIIKRIRYTAEQIIRKLKTAEQLNARGKPVVEVCRVIEVTLPTYHGGRQKYGGMQAEEARRLAQLEKDNAQLKKLWRRPNWRKRCSRILPRETSEPGAPPQGRRGSCRNVTGPLNASSAGWCASTAAPNSTPARRTTWKRPSLRVC
jgi:putative transposase